MEATSNRLGVQHSKVDVVGELTPSSPLISCLSPAKALSRELSLRHQKRPCKERLGHRGGNGPRSRARRCSDPGAPVVRRESCRVGFRGRRQASGSPRATAQSAQEALLLGSRAPLRLESQTRSTRCSRCQTSAGARQGGRSRRSAGLWRHLPRKPRRKCGAPGGRSRSCFGDKPLVRTFSPKLPEMPPEMPVVTVPKPVVGVLPN